MNDLLCTGLLADLSLLQNATTQQWIVGLLLIAIFISFVKEWIPVEITALCATAVLLLTGVMTSKEVLSSFANSGPLTVVCMFILSAALEKTGLIADLSKFFNKATKGNSFFALIFITVGAFAVSPFVNNTPVVVILMPVVIAFCRDHNIAPSKLLIPLSFATILGGTCTVVGTSTNVVVLGQVQKLGYDQIKMFTLAPLGLLYGIVGLLYLWTIGKKLLPSRETLSTLLPQSQQRDFLLQVGVSAESSYIGEKPDKLIQEELHGMRLVEVRRKGFPLQDDFDDIRLEAGDRLLVICNTRKISLAREAQGVDIGWEDNKGIQPMEERDVIIMEGMVGYDSEFIGHTLNELKFRQNFRVLVLAIHRRGKNITGMSPNTRLNEGDTLLLEGPREGIDRILMRKRMIPLSQRPAETYKRNKRGWTLFAMGIFIFVGLLGSFGDSGSFFQFFAQFDPFYLAFIGALIVIITGCVTTKQAYQSVDWSIIFLILGMLCIGDAMSKTGLAQTIAQTVVGSVGFLGPVFMLSALYLLCSILTEMISNNAVAAVMAPLAYEMAVKFEINPLPFILAVMFGASASFSTPIGYQTNTYVYNAGGYKFSDFIKVGLPLNLLLWILFTIVVPMMYSF